MIQQTSSKLPANVFKIHVLIAQRLLEICWTSPATCYNGRASSMFAGSCKQGIRYGLGTPTLPPLSPTGTVRQPEWAEVELPDNGMDVLGTE